MKTFLNVLYRRILYKIPLKFLLVLLAVCAVFIACFSNAVNIPTSNWGGNVMYNGLYNYVGDIIEPNGITQIDIDYTNIDFVCFKRTTPNNGGQYSLDGTTWYNAFNGEIGCVSTTSETLYIRNGSIQFMYFIVGEGYIPSQYTSLQCQTEYNLIPISSVDQNYCTTNNLCPSSECPVCPIGSGGVSSVYINDILHVGAPFIYMNIPEEIDRDYAYTQGGTNMNIDVVGYNQDNEKIEGIITVQNYKPDSYDFTNLVSNVIPLFVPGLCIILLLYFIFRFIKKIF